MATIGTLLSGGECVGVGARAAGLTHLWGFEIENDIAQVACDNGFNVTTADVMELDPTALEVPDVLHASPVCKRASGANQGAELNEDGTKEAPEDIEMGGKIAQFIDVMTPKYFTLENVYGYRNFQAFKVICAALSRNDYSFDYWHLNAADFGVAQTRQRLILTAKLGKGQRIQKPVPTHHDPKNSSPAQFSMFQLATAPYVSWYSAIEDLIPDFGRDVSAPWLKKAVRPYLSKECFMAEAHNMARSPTILTPDLPAMTIIGNLSRRPSHYPSIWVDGQGKHISIRAFGRLQSLPDSYRLPASDKLAGLIVANGVPPLLYQKIIQPMVGGLT